MDGGMRLGGMVNLSLQTVDILAIERSKADNRGCQEKIH